MNCLLIISQYRWSRHYFIVKRDEDNEILYRKCRTLVAMLEDYKRPTLDMPYRYGDIDPKYFNDLKYQRNVNDHGDIYFIPCASVNTALYEMRYYQNCDRRESVGCKKKELIKDIADHHNAKEIQEIVESVFETL